MEGGVGKNKAQQRARRRAYSPEERQVVLRVAVILGQGEASLLCGVPRRTVANWFGLYPEEVEAARAAAKADLADTFKAAVLAYMPQLFAGAHQKVAPRDAIAGMANLLAMYQKAAGVPDKSEAKVTYEVVVIDEQAKDDGGNQGQA